MKKQGVIDKVRATLRPQYVLSTGSLELITGSVNSRYATEMVTVD